MEIIRERDIIRSVRDSWLRQYEHYKSDSIIGGRPVWETTAALKALDLETCSREDVNAAIGVGGWVDNECDNCGQHSAKLVRIGEELDYDARWQDLCISCVEAALKAISAAP